jgi:AraC-like DNA-binding protein
VAADLLHPNDAACRPGWPDRALWATGYREWLPPAKLRAGLSCLWVSVVPAGAGTAATDVMPDGCADLIWQSGHGAYIAGPNTGPVLAAQPAGTIIVAVRFRPGAGGPALGIPLAELRDQQVALTDCLPALARQLPADLPHDQALDRVTGLSAQLSSDGPPDPVVSHAVSLLARGPASVPELSDLLAVSERQLRRRFDAAVGYGPKTLHRVLRFHQVITQLSAGHTGGLAELAFQAGYSDQAHLTRETTRLAGLPPAALARVLLAA